MSHGGLRKCDVCGGDSTNGWDTCDECAENPERSAAPFDLTDGPVHYHLRAPFHMKGADVNLTFNKPGTYIIHLTREGHRGRSEKA